MPQVIKSKYARQQESISYGSLIPLDFDVVTLSSNQTTVTVANEQPVGIAMKVIMLSVVMPIVNGTAAVSVNLCAGTAAEGGIGPTDPLYINPGGGYPPLPTQMMQNGNILWAADQQLNGASAPVVSTVYNLYPVNDMWDAIWPNTLPITLRVAAGAAAANGTLKAVAYVQLVDIHPDMPNTFNPFVPSNAIL